MNKSTIVLSLDDEGSSLLWDLSRAGVAFYNIALEARVKAWENGGRVTRVAQCSELPRLCERAGIGADTLPRSVMTNLLSALDASIFGARDWRPRDRQRFWSLCWAKKDIESAWGAISLVSLPLRLPSPWLYAGQGKAVRVTISQNWVNEQFSAKIEWSPVASTQPAARLLPFVYGICTKANLYPCT